MIKQSTGAFIAVSRYASATPLPPSVLSRGIGWQVNCFMIDRYIRSCLVKSKLITFWVYCLNQFAYASKHVW